MERNTKEGIFFHLTMKANWQLLGSERGDCTGPVPLVDWHYHYIYQCEGQSQPPFLIGFLNFQDWILHGLLQGSGKPCALKLPIIGNNLLLTSGSRG